MFIWSQSVCCNLLAGEAVALSKSEHQRKVNHQLVSQSLCTLLGTQRLSQLCPHTAQMSSVEERLHILLFSSGQVQLLLQVFLLVGARALWRCYHLLSSKLWKCRKTSLKGPLIISIILHSSEETTCVLPQGSQAEPSGSVRVPCQDRLQMKPPREGQNHLLAFFFLFTHSSCK